MKFEEQFPSLAENTEGYFEPDELQKYCLDKEKVIDTIRYAFRMSKTNEDFVNILERDLKLDVNL